MKTKEQQTQEFAGKILDIWGGMVYSASIYLGDKLALYTAMQDGSAITSDELAEKPDLMNAGYANG